MEKIVSIEDIQGVGSDNIVAKLCDGRYNGIYFSDREGEHRTKVFLPPFSELPPELRRKAQDIWEGEITAEGVWVKDKGVFPRPPDGKFLQIGSHVDFFNDQARYSHCGLVVGGYVIACVSRQLVRTVARLAKKPDPESPKYANETWEIILETPFGVFQRGDYCIVGRRDPYCDAPHLSAIKIPPREWPGADEYRLRQEWWNLIVKSDTRDKGCPGCHRLLPLEEAFEDLKELEEIFGDFAFGTYYDPEANVFLEFHFPKLVDPHAIRGFCAYCMKKMYGRVTIKRGECDMCKNNALVAIRSTDHPFYEEISRSNHAHYDFGSYDYVHVKTWQSLCKSCLKKIRLLRAAGGGKEMIIKKI